MGGLRSQHNIRCANERAQVRQSLGAKLRCLVVIRLFWKECGPHLIDGNSHSAPPQRLIVKGLAAMVETSEVMRSGGGLVMFAVPLPVIKRSLLLTWGKPST